MNVILKNGDAMQVAENATCLQAASAISEGLARNAVCAKVNGEEVDLSHVLKEGDSLEIVTLKTKRGFTFTAIPVPTCWRRRLRRYILPVSFP